MNIIQTYWTKPMFQKTEDLYNRIQGGWPSMHHALSAIAYSCLSIHKYYPDIELVTDAFGGHLLIDTLGLPYKDVKLDLDRFDVDLNLWALAKVYSYSLQEKPFIHIDNDIFIWDKFPKRIEEARLCCQNVESLTPDYIKALDIMRRQFKDIPDLFRDVVKRMNSDNAQEYGSINAGILGGNDVDFLNKYAIKVLECYNNYKQCFSVAGSNIGLFNIVLEQLAFGILSESEEIEFLISENLQFDEIINRLINIYTAPIETKFVHCLGEVKKYVPMAEQIEMRLRYEYPSYYAKVVNFCQENGYPISFNKDYHGYEKTYKIICQFRNAEQFMRNAYFCLKKNVYFREENGVTYLYCNAMQQEVSGWGKILLFMNSYVNGDTLSELLYRELSNDFCMDFIRENVMSYLIQILYTGELIDIKIG